MNEYYTVREAAKLLNREPNTLRRYLQKKKVPGSKLMGRWALSKKWVDERTVNPQNLLWDKDKSVLNTFRPVHKKQKIHIRKLQQLAKTALDSLPYGLPDFEDINALFSFNDRVVKVYRRLMDDDDWPDLSVHLGEDGIRIEKLSGYLDDILPGGRLVKPDLMKYNQYLTEAWSLIKSGGIKTISESADTRKWELLGLMQRCKNCPDINYESVGVTPDDYDDGHTDQSILEYKYWRISSRKSH